MSTPSEPSGASGPHPLYPTEMGLFLENTHTIQKDSTGGVFIEATVSTLYTLVTHSMHQTEEGLTHAAVQVDATGLPEWED